MKSTEPVWFSKLSASALERARQWLRADPEAFTEIVAADKRGRPKAANGPDAPYENMAQLLTDNPGMKPRTAARFSVQLAPDPMVTIRARIARLERDWAKVGHRYLKTEQQRRKRKELPPAYLSNSFGPSYAEAGSSLFGRSYQEVAAEIERDHAARIAAEKDYPAALARAKLYAGASGDWPAAAKQHQGTGRKE